MWIENVRHVLFCLSIHESLGLGSVTKVTSLNLEIQNFYKGNSRKKYLDQIKHKTNNTQDELYMYLAHKLPESFILGQSQPPILIILYKWRLHSFQFLSLKTESSVDWFDHMRNNPILLNKGSLMIAIKKFQSLVIVVSHLLFTIGIQYTRNHLENHI